MLGKRIGKSPRVFYVKTNDFTDWNYYLSFPQIRISSVDLSLDLDYFNSYHHSRFIYKFTMKQPFDTPPSVISSRDIESIETLYTPPPVDKKYIRTEISTTDPAFDSIMTWLKSYLRVGINITKPLEKQVVALGLHLPEPVRVYRGLYLLDMETVLQLGLDKLRVGDHINIQNRDKVVSWSTDLCVSKYFATKPVMNSIEFLNSKKKFHFGVILTTVLKPTDILVDTRVLTREARFQYQQSEVMTRRTNAQGNPLTFDCTIYQLFITSPYSPRSFKERRFLPVMSFGPLLKDLKQMKY